MEPGRASADDPLPGLLAEGRARRAHDLRALARGGALPRRTDRASPASRSARGVGGLGRPGRRRGGGAARQDRAGRALTASGRRRRGGRPEHQRGDRGGDRRAPGADVPRRRGGPRPGGVDPLHLPARAERRLRPRRGDARGARGQAGRRPPRRLGPGTAPPFRRALRTPERPRPAGDAAARGDDPPGSRRPRSARPPHDGDSPRGSPEGRAAHPRVHASRPHPIHPGRLRRAARGRRDAALLRAAAEAAPDSGRAEVAQGRLRRAAGGRTELRGALACLPRRRPLSRLGAGGRRLAQAARDAAAAQTRRARRLETGSGGARAAPNPSRDLRRDRRRTRRPRTADPGHGRAPRRARGTRRGSRLHRHALHPVGAREHGGEGGARSRPADADAGVELGQPLEQGGPPRASRPAARLERDTGPRSRRAPGRRARARRGRRCAQFRPLLLCGGGRRGPAERRHDRLPRLLDERGAGRADDLRPLARRRTRRAEPPRRRGARPPSSGRRRLARLDAPGRRLPATAREEGRAGRSRRAARGGRRRRRPEHERRDRGGDRRPPRADVPGRRGRARARKARSISPTCWSRTAASCSMQRRSTTT